MTQSYNLKKIAQLRGTLEHVLFKGFAKIYEYPEGMNFTHIETLMFLSFFGRSPMSELSRKLNLEKGSFTPVSKKLIALELIRKTRNETDKRVYELSLTDKGLAIAEDFRKQHHLFMEDLLKDLDDKKKEEFFKAVDLVTETVAALDKNPHDNFCFARKKVAEADSGKQEKAN